jgi:hypothetical protein
MTEENNIKNNLRKIIPVIDFIIGYAEILVSITSVLFSQAEVIDYLSSPSFGQSITFTGGGPICCSAT